MDDPKVRYKAELAKRMREAMKRARMTQTEVANRMGESVANVNRWVDVRGLGRKPNNSALLNFANVVGTTVEALLGTDTPDALEGAAKSLDALQRREGAAAAATAGGIDPTPEFTRAADELLATVHHYLDDEWAHLNAEQKLQLLQTVMRLRSDRRR